MTNAIAGPALLIAPAAAPTAVRNSTPLAAIAKASVPKLSMYTMKKDQAPRDATESIETPP